MPSTGLAQRPGPDTMWRNRKTKRVAKVLHSSIDPGHVFYVNLTPRRDESFKTGAGYVVRMTLARFHALFTPFQADNPRPGNERPLRGSHISDDAIDFLVDEANQQAVS